MFYENSYIAAACTLKLQVIILAIQRNYVSDKTITKLPSHT